MPEPSLSSELAAISRQVLSDSLREGLQVNQVIAAQVLEKLPKGELLLLLDGHIFNARTNLDLNRGQTIHARVQSVQPTTVLQILTENRPAPTDAGVAQFRDPLHRMGLIANEQTLKSAAAFSREGLPLQKNLFEPFLKLTHQLNLTQPPELQAAAHLYRLELPVKPSLVAGLQESVQLPPSPMPPESGKIQLLEHLASVLPPESKPLDSLRPLLQKVLDHFQARTPIDPQKPAETAAQLKATLPDPALRFEQNWIRQSIRALVQPDKLPDFAKETANKFQEIKALLTQPGSQPLQKMVSAITPLVNTLTAQASTLENLAREIPSSPLPSDMISQNAAREILSLLQTMDRLETHLNSFQGQSPVIQEIKTMLSEPVDAVFKNFENLLAHEGSRERLVTVFRESGMLASSPQTAFDAPILPDNIKHVLLSLKQALGQPEIAQTLYDDRSATGQPNTTPRELTDATREIIQEQLSQITRQQFQSLDLQGNMTTLIQNIALQVQGERHEISVVYQEMDDSGSTGSSEGKAFRVYFALHLSNLGSIEINLLEHRGHLDILFYSEAEPVQKLLEDNSRELARELARHGLQSVSIKSLKKKPAPEWTFAATVGPKDPSRLDITI